MSIKKNHDETLVQIGELLKSKRDALGKKYSTREQFIFNRSVELFAGEDWISVRHLCNIENGRNWISIPLLLTLAQALEVDPTELFREIVAVIRNSSKET